ncbi:MAG TPA: vitamin K epoxide reductase family protein [Candidatus Sulfotelmatobacter sp.]|nr:vitamin K epoxide reductase family protein [Candidatus Sulfotelmatobacter sp.]
MTDPAPISSSVVPSVRRANRVLFAVIAILSLAGILVSAISLQRHYAKSATAYCDFSQKFSCDIVNRSEYSTLMGFPVAGIGVAGYAFLLFLSTFKKSEPETPNRLLGAAIAGLLFALYLTYIEAFVLTAWCIMCLMSLVLIALISLFAIVMRLRTARV